ncbi:ComEC/Rec2 family competence protein [Luteolibacter yonseiensis]|uniref:ComEC/Rec2 family competence protein n=1 Tax=Luteolibacter yonseiensis TaxID=1144680 RepID=A0A934R1K2_9BACT|nr:ComEC/Rec2 family competence protein [Luteolibacter yonseiensis]MBK1814453.1 ComEC/Rec2 family competence protein [Luteolibacter yonseiensis]
MRWTFKLARRGHAANLMGRQPLFFAALVASACVLTAGLDGVWAQVLAVAAGLAGWWLGNGRTGASWWLCGLVAAGVFSWRTESRDADERGLLASGGGMMEGRVMKDGKGGGDFWRAPVILSGGPHAGVKVWWEGKGKSPVAGSRVRAEGSFGPLPVPRNPGEFDPAAWLRCQGVAAVFRASHITGEVETGTGAAFGAAIRQGFRSAVTDGLAEDSQAVEVIRAVVIGEQPPDAEELIAPFRNSGTLHAFSVSGMHVGMVALIGWFVLGACGMPRRWAVLVLLPLIFGYSWLTGNSPPAVRSAWMAAVFLAAFVTRRRPDLLNSLGAVLLVGMLWDGRLLFLPGVQLSYFVVAAIAVGADWTRSWFSWLAKPELYLPLGVMTGWQRFWLRSRQKLATSLEVSVAAAIGSTPLTVYHFGLLTPVSIVSNLFISWLILIMLCGALFSAAVHPFVPGVARMVNGLNGKVADLCVSIAKGFSAIPGGHYQLRQETEPFLLVYDLERGAGAACFSDGGSGAVMFDCADRYHFRRSVAPSLRRLGVAPDSVVLSHPDGGHLGGGDAVWSAFPIKQAVLPVEKSRSPAFRAWLDDSPAHGVKLLHVADFKNLPLPDGATLEVIHVPAPRSQNARADDRVAVFRMHWRGWKLLFTSDAGMNTEMAILDQKQDVEADVIIAGHHRGNVMLCDAFLAAVKPRAIVASHADFPFAEALRPQTVASWRSQGIKVVHQGEAGGVTLRVDDDGNLRLEGFVDRSATVLERR